jgi:hypothetical protein
MSLLLALVACSAERDVNDPMEENIKVLAGEDLLGDYTKWFGRYHLKDERVFFYHTGTGFHVAFSGSALEFTIEVEKMKEDIYFSLARDGESLLDGETIVIDEPKKTIQVVFDTYDDHTIEFVKRSEPEDGATALLDVRTNGTLKPVTVLDRPHFLLIGASGMSGHGALGQVYQPRTTENSSSLHAFGYLTASAFASSFEFVSNSGWGLVYGFNDRSGETNIAKAYPYVGIDPDQNIIEAPALEKKTADVIIVNIGGNDYSSVINRLTGFDREEAIDTFKDAVIDFVLTLREDAPSAHIFWTMTRGSMNGTAAEQAIALLESEDRAYVHVVVIKGVGDDGDPIGANNHSSYQTHLRSADLLISEIERYTNLTATEMETID